MNIKYTQGFQYEPPKLVDGKAVRDGRIVISTDESKDGEKRNEPEQHDANYLAI